jgi:HlyD family secretion protein
MFPDTGKSRALVVSDHAPEAKLSRNLRVGMITVGVLVFGIGGLAATVPIAGAVVASGEVTVESLVKRIGHPTGGVVADVLVHDGDRVQKGQLLMRLDATVSGANATIAEESVDQLLAREARLAAERDGRPAPVFPPALTQRASDPKIATLMAEEMRVFTVRRNARLSQEAELDQRVSQSLAEIGGYQAQVASVRDQSKFIQQELTATRSLWEQHYTTLERLSQLERTAASLRGDEASSLSSIARARSQISEIRQQKDALEQDAHSQASTELSDVQAKLSENRQKNVAAADVNRRNDIVSPSDGIVDKLAFTTIGGVVPPNMTIMEIVPDTDRLIVTARIAPSDIDQVQPDMPVNLRFSAFNAQSTPQIGGEGITVSADRNSDERTGAAYYKALIRISPDELKRLGALRLRPGMPVEAFIRTGNRTLLSYLTKPLRDQLQRAFRHD